MTEILPPFLKWCLGRIKSLLTLKNDSNTMNENKQFKNILNPNKITMFKTLKNSVTLFVALAIFMTNGVVFAATSTFKDVPTTAWYHDFVQDLVDTGIVDKADNYRPDDPVNRAELVKMVINKTGGFFGYTAPGISPFIDTKKGEWYYDYIQAASKKGIISGYMDEYGSFTGKFGPGDNVTRGQATKILVNAFNIPSTLMPASTFVDVDKNAWYNDYVLTAYNQSIIDGYKDSSGNPTGKFGPNNYVTRAEIAKMIVNAQNSQLKSITSSGSSSSSSGSSSSGSSSSSSSGSSFPSSSSGSSSSSSGSSSPSSSSGSSSSSSSGSTSSGGLGTSGGGVSGYTSWATYTETGAFSIEYPKEWKADNFSVAIPLNSSNPDYSLLFDQDGSLMSVFATVNVKYNLKNQTLSQIWQDMVTADPTHSKISDITMDGVAAIKYTYNGQNSPYGYIFEHGNLIYDIITKTALIKEHTDTVNKMLTSFKFLSGGASATTPGTLTVTSDNSKITDAIAVAGTKILVSKYIFSAKGESFMVTDLPIINDDPNKSDFDDLVATGTIKNVSIEYPDKNGIIQTSSVPYLVGGGGYMFNKLNFYIKKDNSEELKVYVETYPIISSTFSLSGKSFRVGLAQQTVPPGSIVKGFFIAIGESSLNELSNPSVFNNQDDVPIFILRKSKPVFANIIDPGSGIKGSAQDIYSFRVSAEGGNVGISRLVFKIETKGLASSGSEEINFVLSKGGAIMPYPFGDYAIWAQKFNGDKTSQAVSVLGTGGLSQCESTSGIADGTYFLVVTFTKEQIIAKGISNDYSLKAVISGADTGDKITVSMAYDTSEVSDIDTAYNNDNAFGNTAHLVGSGITASASKKDALFPGGLIAASDPQNQYFGNTVNGWIDERNIIWSDYSGGDNAGMGGGTATVAAHTYPTILFFTIPGTVTPYSGTLDWTNGYKLNVEKLTSFIFTK